MPNSSRSFRISRMSLSTLGGDKTGRRLVQHEERRLAHHAPCDLDHSLLADGER